MYQVCGTKQVILAPKFALEVLSFSLQYRKSVFQEAETVNPHVRLVSVFGRRSSSYVKSQRASFVYPKVQWSNIGAVYQRSKVTSFLTNRFLALVKQTGRLKLAACQSSLAVLLNSSICIFTRLGCPLFSWDLSLHLMGQLFSLWPCSRDPFRVFFCFFSTGVPIYPVLVLGFNVAFFWDNYPFSFFTSLLAGELFT